MFIARKVLNLPMVRPYSGMVEKLSLIGNLGQVACEGKLGQNDQTFTVVNLSQSDQETYSDF